MLRPTSDLTGLAIHATDGNIGAVKDIYFDDIHWRVRYFVVDTGAWLPGRLVLISPASIENADLGKRQLNVKLTKDQVKSSPDIESHETVSRQHEQHMAKYYGWPVYWPVEGPLGPQVEDQHRGDANLRATSEVRGYYVHAKDGDLGHVAEFLIDDAAWEVRYVVVDTRNWIPGKKVLVDPRATQEVDWAKSTVHVKLSKNELEHLPTYDRSGTHERHDQAHVEQFARWPTYWY